MTSGLLPGHLWTLPGHLWTAPRTTRRTPRTSRRTHQEDPRTSRRDYPAYTAGGTTRAYTAGYYPGTIPRPGYTPYVHPGRQPRTARLPAQTPVTALKHALPELSLSVNLTFRLSVLHLLTREERDISEAKSPLLGPKERITRR